MNSTNLIILSLIVLLPISVIAQNSTRGTWGPVINSKVNATGAANLPDGKILTWSAATKEDSGGSNGTQTYTAIFDPARNSFSDRLVNETRHDMFCPGTANLPDGRIMIAGGRTTTRTTIYDPVANTYREDDEMNTPRGYQTNVTLTDGRVFTLGGSWSGGRGNKNAEVWSQEAGWIPYPAITANATIRQGSPDPEGVYRDDNHAWLFAAPSGRIFHAGPGTDMHWIDLNGVGSVTNAGRRANDSYSMNGNAVMYDIGKILTIGGASSYSANTNSTSNTHVIDINGGNVSVTRVSNMKEARTFHNSVVLPNGEVVTIGGMQRSRIFSDDNAKMTAEIWNPQTRSWTEGTAMSVPRTYHSTAILMQDGRVWTGGGGLCGNCGVNHTDMQIYTPPYLYGSNNNLATRPVINSAPTSASYNSSITVRSNTSISDFSLVRLSSVTHSVNVEQRRVPLNHTSSSSTIHQVTIPGNDLLPPGNYFLFAMNSAGVPSIAKTIRIGGGTSSSTEVPNGDYYISSSDNGQYIGAPSFDSRNVRMLDNSNVTDRQWRITSIAPGVYTIQNLDNGEYMEVPFGGCQRDANIATFNRVVADHQKWNITKVGEDYFFRPLHCTSFGLDKSNGENGNVKIWNFSVGNRNQKFRLIPVTGGGGSSISFVPDPNKRYYLEASNRRLAATGSSENAYTTSVTSTGPDVEWRFVQHSTGYWHMQRAAGGATPRIRTDNSQFADMQSTGSSGIYTYYTFNAGANPGTHFLTLPDGPNNFRRLQLTTDRQVKFVPDSYRGSQVSWRITEVPTTSGPTPAPTNPTPTSSGNGISVSFANPSNNARFSSGQSIGVTVNASDSNGSISNVRLFRGNTLVRQENITPYEWGSDNGGTTDAAIQNLSPGTYTLRAVATDNAGNNQEASISITIEGGGCNTISNVNFESGLSIWNDGGSDCAAINNNSFSNSGTWSMRLRDNSGQASSMFTDVINMSSASEAIIRFSFLPQSFETNENFFLEVSSNGGSSYSQVRNWIVNRDFTNDQRQNVEVTVPGNQLSSNTRFRIRCDASGNADLVYIDDVVIESCGSRLVDPSQESTVTESEVDETITVGSFDATPLDGQKSDLNWSYVHSDSVESFVIQYATEYDNDFVDIDSIVTIDGLDYSDYSYVHESPVVGINFYRVKVKFTDGKVDYLPFRNVAFEKPSAPINIFPNPASNQLSIDLSNYMEEKVSYFVSNAIGEIITSGEFDENHAEVNKIDLSKFQNGNYFIHMRPDNQRETSQQFVIIKE